MNYGKYDTQAAEAFNNQMSQAATNQAEAQQTYNQSNNLYNKAEGQDQREYETSRANVQNIANEQEATSKEVGGQQALDTFNQQVANHQNEAGYNADLNKSAMQNLNQAVGAESAYNDLLNTSGYNFGQNAGARAAAESSAESGLNNNIAANQQVANGQQAAFMNGATVGNEATSAMLTGQQNQMSAQNNAATTNLGLLSNANAMYSTDLGNWINGVNAGTGLYNAASGAVAAGANAENSIRQAEAQESQAKIVNPSTAAANYAQANLSNAEAAVQRYNLQQAQALDAQKASSIKALTAQLTTVQNKCYSKTMTEKVKTAGGIEGFFAGMGSVIGAAWTGNDTDLINNARGYATKTVDNPAYTQQQSTVSDIKKQLASYGVYE